MANFSLGSFALDLGPLEKSSGVLIIDRKRSASIVDSEDDGPSDFTQNLGKWMKGTDTYNQSDSQKSKDADTQAREHSIEHPTPASDHAQPTVKATDQRSRDLYDFANDSLFTEPLGSSTPSPRFMVQKPTVEDVPDDSVYPLPTQGQLHFTERPPLARAPDSPSPVSHRQSGSDPGVPADTALSQPSLQQEMNTAVKPSSRRNSSSQIYQSGEPLSRQNSGSQHAPQAELFLRPDSRSQHSAPVDAFKLDIGSSQQDTSSVANTNSMQAQCGAIQAPIRSRSKSRCEEDPSVTSPAPPRSRRNSHSKQEPAPAVPPAPLSRLNTETKQNNAAEEVFSHISALQAEVERLRHENQQLRTANTNLASANAQYHTAYQTLEREQEQQQADHDKLERAHTQQTHTYQTSERNYTDLQLRHDNLEVKHEKLEAQSRDQRTEFVSQVNKLNDDLATTRSSIQEHESATAQHIDVLKSQHESHIAELQGKHKSEAQERENDILRERKAMTMQLNNSQAALSSARNEVSTLKERLVDIENQISDMHAVNREMEVRFAAAVEAREEEWMRRMELLFRDREKMSKALMTEWGKREVGKVKFGTEGKKGQAYRYRYAKA